MLVKEHNGQFFVFNVMAESWGDGKNELSYKQSLGNFPTREEAHKHAHEIDNQDEWGGSEYGVVDDVLCKDGASVTITDLPPKHLKHQYCQSNCPAYTPPKPSEPIELEDIIDDYMPSNDEQDALAKSLMKDDLLEWVKSLPKKEGK